MAKKSREYFANELGNCASCDVVPCDTAVVDAMDLRGIYLIEQRCIVTGSLIRHKQIVEVMKGGLAKQQMNCNV